MRFPPKPPYLSGAPQQVGKRPELIKSEQLLTVMQNCTLVSPACDTAKTKAISLRGSLAWGW